MCSSTLARSAALNGRVGENISAYLPSLTASMFIPSLL